MRTVRIKEILLSRGYGDASIEKLLTSDIVHEKHEEVIASSISWNL